MHTSRSELFRNNIYPWMGWVDIVNMISGGREGGSIIKGMGRFTMCNSGEGKKVQG